LPTSQQVKSEGKGKHCCTQEREKKKVNIRCNVINGEKGNDHIFKKEGEESKKRRISGVKRGIEKTCLIGRKRKRGTNSVIQPRREEKTSLPKGLQVLVKGEIRG